MIKKDYLYFGGLLLFTTLFIWMLYPSDSYFGSNTDWFSQHISISEYFRTQFYQNGNLFPDYANALGGGQNIYAFSYYGLFRPDILISYALPMIDMKTIIITTMILHLYASVTLCFIWLKRLNYNNLICFICAIMLLSSSLFFQSHRQIMFVNYIPYLITALMSIDNFSRKAKSFPLTLSILLMILNSYFFSVTGIGLCLIYALLTNKKQYLYKIIICIWIAVLCAGVLLLPTVAVMLEQKRSKEAIDFLSLFIPDFSFHSLLYQVYGCGFTSIVLVLIGYGLYFQSTRKEALFLLIVFLFPFFSYLGNGLLYARSKALLPFLPLTLHLCAEVLQQYQKSTPVSFLPCLFIIPCCFYNIWIGVDAAVVALILHSYKKTYKSKILLLLCISPCINAFIQNKQESYVTHKQYAQAYNSKKMNTLQSISTKQPIRINDFTSPLAVSNQVVQPTLMKTSMYTSLTNPLYNSFCHDVMKLPIRIKNRTAILDSSQIFFQMLMNTVYLYTEKEAPAGYQKTVIDDKLYENKEVLPLAYGTNHLLHKDEFNTLKYPYTLDTLIYNAIVEAPSQNTVASKIEKKEILPTIKENGVIKTKKGYHIRLKQNKTFSIPISTKEKEILIIRFKITNNKNPKKEINIIINEIKNKYSGTKVAYPNNHLDFAYVLSSNDSINQLNIIFSKGEYDIEAIETYTLPYQTLLQKDITPFHFQQTNHNEIIKGTITMKDDGYFVTTLPISKGYTAYINHQKAKIETINTAFVGFPLKKGTNTIRILFNAPGKKLGQIFSFLGLILTFIQFVYERRIFNE